MLFYEVRSKRTVAHEADYNKLTKVADWLPDMNRKIPPLMIFALLWLTVVLVSWFNFPAWRNMEGGLATLVGVAAVGVLAFLKDGVSFLKDSLEYLKGTLAEPETPNVVQPDDDSKITNISWKSVDPELIKKYLALCESRDKKFTQLKNEEKLLRHCVSMGLAKKDKAGIFLTYAGVLLFCKKEMFPHSLLHSDVTLRDEERDATRPLRGSILETYFLIREYLNPYLGVWDDPKTRDGLGVARKFSDYPDVAITEALVNFFVHRDYQSEDIGYVTIFSNRIEFENPGASQYSAERLLTYEEPLHPRNRRNPRLLQVLQDTGLNQREGRGILRIREELKLNESYLSDGGLGLVIDNDIARDRFVLTIYKKDRPKSQELIDSIGFIPAVNAVTYIHRGKIEDDLIAFIRKGGKGAIVGLHAPGGLGKTELAKQVAENLKDEFEILWVDVGEKKPHQVVGELLIKCGVQAQRNDSYERLIYQLQGAYQTRRFLVVLDDVRQAMLEKLGDVLPPSSCAALITSRIQQIGGVKTYGLDSMSWEQSRELFKAILGDEVVSNELDALMVLANRCKFNPLAMEIAARRIRQLENVRKPVARYFEIAKTRITELKIEGDTRWDMEHIFDISYDALKKDDREKFQSLSAFHPTGFSIEAVSFLWKTETSVSRQILSRFINLSLVRAVETEDERLERYYLHDLLDEYAALKLIASGAYNSTKETIAQWIVQLFDNNYVPYAENLPFILPERNNLLYACEWARSEKKSEVLALLATKARNWFYVNFSDAWIYWLEWLESSLQLGITDMQLKANVLQAIGDVQQFRRENDAAIESYNEALKLFRQVGAKLGEANVLQAIGDVQQFRKENDAAIESYNRALKLFRQVGAKLGEANVLQAIGDVQQFRDDRDAALQSYNEALKLFRQVGAILGEANVRKAIGDVQQFRDDRDTALENYNEALKLFRQVGDKLGEANVLQAIGDVQQFRDERDAALESYNEALKLFRQVGAKLGEANVLQAIGDVQQFRDEQDAALESYNEALTIFRQAGAILGEANVLQAIGDVQQFRKENNDALESYYEALTIFRQVGAKLGEANVRKAIGDVQQSRDERDAALESYNEALILFRQVGDKLGEANVRKAIGDVQQSRDERDAALESYNEALTLFRQVGDKLGEANVLTAIGDVQQFRDEQDAALESYNEALTLFRQVGAKLGEANVLMSLARLSLHVGNIEIAEKQLEQAIEIQRMIGNLYGEGANFANYAISLLELGDKEKAREYAKRALPIFTKINSPLVEQVNRIIEATNQ